MKALALIYQAMHRNFLIYKGTVASIVLKPTNLF